MWKRRLACACAAFLACGPTASAQEPSSAFDTLIRAEGLEDLTTDQREKVKNLIVRALRAGQADETLTETANAYMSREGFDVCDVSVARVDGDDWLVVRSGYRRAATKDVPLMLSTVLFRDGKYFCKKSLMGGISELLDTDGDRHSFLFAKWVDLR